MVGKTVIISIGAALLIAVFGYRLYAQRLPSQDAAAALQGLSGFEGAMASLRGVVEKNNKELSQKLDQVLANQQVILKELEIVKVRASRK